MFWQKPFHFRRGNPMLLPEQIIFEGEYHVLAKSKSFSKRKYIFWQTKRRGNSCFFAKNISLSKRKIMFWRKYISFSKRKIMFWVKTYHFRKGNSCFDQKHIFPCFWISLSPKMIILSDRTTSATSNHEIQVSPA